MIKYTYSYNISSKMNKIYLEKFYNHAFSWGLMYNKQKEKKTLSELLPRITMFIEYKMIHTILTKEV